MIDLHGTTDAVVWAKEFIKVVDEIGVEFVTEDLLVTWFANAFGAQETNQTAVEAIEHAYSRATYYQIVNDGAEGYHELFVAMMKLDEARMWFTKGLALAQGKFNPADLEKENE